MDSTIEAKAHELMRSAFEVLTQAKSTRENSIARTKLEEAIMWNNKDRTIKGEFDKNKTFVN